MRSVLYDLHKKDIIKLCKRAIITNSVDKI